MFLITVMEVDQNYTVFNYGPPTPHKELNYQGIIIVAKPGMKPAQKYQDTEKRKL